MTAARIGNWMQTSSGRAYWPIDPRPDEVFIEDIAHALSNICRYGGHCRRFYSVAEHSVLVSHLVPPADALAALMHDATEAYCCDVPRPLKGHLKDYKAIEHGNWVAIAARFGLPVELPASVHHADVAMLFAEQKALMRPSPRPDWGMGLVTPLVGDPKSVQALSPDLAEQLFLRRFRQLGGQAHAVEHVAAAR